MEQQLPSYTLPSFSPISFTSTFLFTGWTPASHEQVGRVDLAICLHLRDVPVLFCSQPGAPGTDASRSSLCHLSRQMPGCVTSPVGLALISHPLSSCSFQPRTSPPYWLSSVVRLAHKSKLIKPASLEDFAHLIPACPFAPDFKETTSSTFLKGLLTTPVGRSDSSLAWTSYLCDCF